MHTKKLTKESEKALAIFRKQFESWDGNAEDTLEVSPQQLLDGYIQVSKQPIILQRGLTWRWNRTVNAKNIEFSEGYVATLQKMNSRKSKDSYANIPPLKVWLFSAVKTDQEPIYIVWCEKGLQESELEHEETRIPSISEFAFLKQFVTPAVASELNWNDDDEE